MKIRWSNQAKNQLSSIFQAIADRNPGAARALLERLRSSEQVLVANPYLGRMVPEFQQATLRERIVAPYRVIYHVDADLITVLTVLHSRQDLRHLGNG